MQRAIRASGGEAPNFGRNPMRRVRAWAQHVPRPRTLIIVAVISMFDFVFVACRPSGATRETEVVAPTPEVALRGIADREHVRVLLEPDRGSIHCTIDATRTPMPAALFVGLSTRRPAHLDPRTVA